MVMIANNQAGVQESFPGRFSREQLAGYEPETMQDATVLVVGAGALAQSVIPNLALPGVGEIRLCDFDVFEPHNHARSLYFPLPHEQELLGMLKAKVVATKARAHMLAAAPIMRYAVAPIQQLGLGAFDGVDVVISAVDNPRARAYLSDTCRYLGITLIEGGFDGPSVSMSVFPATNACDAERQPCYRCSNPQLTGTFSCQRVAQEAARAGVIAAIQPAAAALAGMQAEAAIQSIHGNHPTGFKRTSLNVRTGQHRQYQLSRNPKCPGIHARLAGPAVELAVSPADPIAKLIDAIEQHLGAGATIDLGEPLVAEAYCLICHDVITVEALEWAYDMEPRCSAATCGGPWVSQGPAPDGHSPIKPVEINRRTETRILDLPCAKAGLVARSLVHTFQPDSDASMVFRMPGSLDDLYTRVP